MGDAVILSTVELQMLSELDSRQFGFLKLSEEQHSRKKAVVVKAIKYLERFIVRSRERQRRAQDDNNNGRGAGDARALRDVDPKIYCKLGHLHLLLEDYSKALSAFQKYFKLDKHHWKDTAFLFGLGLVYFHFNAYLWARRAFQQVLYSDPGFQKAKEISKLTH